MANQKPQRKSTRRRSRVPIHLAVILLLMLLIGWGLWPREVGQRGEGDQRRGPPPGPAADEAVYLPAEFDAQETLLLGGSQLVDLYPAVLADMVGAAHAAVEVLVLVHSAEDRHRIGEVLAGADLPPEACRFLELPIRSMWVRDFGPVTVVDAGGGRRLVDFVYRERRGNTLDNDVPVHLARSLNLPRVASHLLLEGGDFLSNGRGLCLGSTRLMDRNAYYLQLEPQEVARELAERLGFEDLILLAPLQGETTGHLDMFCAFLRPDQVVVGRIDPAVDPANAALLDRTAARLAGAATLAGPLQVERILFPPPEDDIWRTYTNLVFANEVVLVPVYPDCCPDLDAAALAVYRRLLPDRRIAAVDASQLVNMRGALRCVTMNMAAGSAVPR